MEKSKKGEGRLCKPAGKERQDKTRKGKGKGKALYYDTMTQDEAKQDAV